MNAVKLIVLSLVLLPVLASATIEFQKKNVKGDLSIGMSSPELISFSFVTEFETGCSTECGPGQDFRIGFSNESADGGNYQDYDSIVLNIEDLGNYISNSISYTVSGNAGFLQSGYFALGSWSNKMQTNDNQSEFQATFDIKLNRDKLLDYLDGKNKKNFTFYVIAQDVQDTGHHDYIKVKIEVKQIEEVKISGLQDVVFDKADMPGTLSGGFDFCVFSSTGKAKIEINGSCNSDEPLLLGPSGVCDGDNEIKYELILTHKDTEASKKYKKDGQKDFLASQDVSCNATTNMRLDVEIKENEYKNKPAGVYTDTVTVTVSPK